MKKMIIIALFIILSVPAFSQFMLFEQDIRFNTPTGAIPLTQIQGDAPLDDHWSIGPYVGTTYDWTECLWFVNYETGPLSFGLGVGGEQTMDISWRVSPWIKFAPQVGADTTKHIEFFSLWEFGSGKDNYWYTNMVTYESSKLSAGVLARRQYGIGPIVGWKIKVGDWNMKFSGAPLYDLKDKVLKPTLILTITN
jgi:hypothetical protein